MKFKGNHITIGIALILPVFITWASQSLSSSVTESALNLNRYEIIHSVIIEGVEVELSGITYSSNTNSLFAVINRPARLIEMDLDGRIVREIELSNFDDTEGVTHIHDDYYAITQEQLRRITFVRITPQTTTLDARDQKSFKLDIDGERNKGLEGLAWSSTSGLFVANEKFPSRVTHLPRTLFAGMEDEGRDYGNILPTHFNDLSLIDISGLHVVDHQKRLLVLSDESLRILEVDFNGDVQSEFDFTRGPFGIFNHIEQPEGVMMDKNGRIYVVGEPNVLLVMGQQV